MSIELGPSPALLTIPQVAELLKVSVATVRRLQQHRRIAFHKVGGCVRFKPSDVTSYLDKQRVCAIDQ
jgi:excisionase family DNA binding protein